MILRDLTLTPGLLCWLRSRHDDGQPELRARQRGTDIEVTRQDGSELSEYEQSHVRGVVSAHRTEPFL